MFEWFERFEWSEKFERFGWFEWYEWFEKRNGVTIFAICYPDRIRSALKSNRFHFR
jgi:plasmid replication initiation protein